MTLDEEIARLDQAVRKYRSLMYLLGTDEFRQLYNGCPDGTTEIDYYIKSNDLDAVKQWIEDQRHRHLNLCTVIQLRTIARRLGVYNYNTLRRDQLIQVITKQKERLGVGRSDSSDSNGVTTSIDCPTSEANTSRAGSQGEPKEVGEVGGISG